MSITAPARKVLERTQDVVAYQHDPDLTGRPIGTMFMGGVLALVSAVLCARLVFSIWYLNTVEPQYGLFGVSFLFVLYVLGAYFFALGYELYDVPRAVRLTVVFALFGVVALVFMIGALVALAFIQGSATLAFTEGQKTKALTAASYLGGAGEQEEDAGKRAADIPGFATITCKHCDRDFFPVPPDAVCPWCDTAYLPSYPASPLSKAG